MQFVPTFFQVQIYYFFSFTLVLYEGCRRVVKKTEEQMKICKEGWMEVKIRLNDHKEKFSTDGFDNFLSCMSSMREI